MDKINLNPGVIWENDTLFRNITHKLLMNFNVSIDIGKENVLKQKKITLEKIQFIKKAMGTECIRYKR